MKYNFIKKKEEENIGRTLVRIMHRLILYDGPQQTDNKQFKRFNVCLCLCAKTVKRKS